MKRKVFPNHEPEARWPEWPVLKRLFAIDYGVNKTVDLTGVGASTGVGDVAPAPPALEGEVLAQVPSFSVSGQGTVTPPPPALVPPPLHALETQLESEADQLGPDARLDDVVARLRATLQTMDDEGKIRIGRVPPQPSASFAVALKSAEEYRRNPRFYADTTRYKMLIPKALYEALKAQPGVVVES